MAQVKQQQPSLPVAILSLSSSKIPAYLVGEVELPEFIQIMTMTREAEQEATFWGDRTPRKHSQGDEAVPLHYLTAAYRRKRTVDAIMDPELRQVYIDSPGHANNR